jgi:hypothetical protein
MIVVRSSTVVDVPIEQPGTTGPISCVSGDVTFEPVSVARTRVTLSVQLDLSPSDDATGPEVEETYRRAVAHLDRYRDFAEMR